GGLRCSGYRQGRGEPFRHRSASAMQDFLPRRAAQIVEQDDFLPFLQEAFGQIATDEACPTGDDDGCALTVRAVHRAHETRPRSSSCRRICAALSAAPVSRTHSANSPTESSSRWRGSKPRSSRALETSAKQ